VPTGTHKHSRKTTAMAMMTAMTTARPQAHVHRGADDRHGDRKSHPREGHPGVHRRWGRVCVTVPLPLAQVEHKIVRASHDAITPTFPASRPTTDLIAVLNVPEVRR